MYFGAGWFNATTGTGYGIHKNSNLLQFTYVTGTAGVNGTLKTAMTINSSGYLGIGTSSPTNPLTIVGSTTIQGYSFYVGGNASTFYPVFIDTSPSWETTNTYRFNISRSSVHLDASWKGGTTIIVEGHNYAWGNGSDFLKYKIVATGGTYSNFVANIFEDGTTQFVVIYLRGATTYYFSGQGCLLNNANASGTSLTISGGQNVTYASTTTITTNFGSSSASGDNRENIWTMNGNVGIGTANPSSLLHVNGAINCTSFLVNGTAVATGTGSVWGVNGSYAYYTSGYVGIGTTAPITNLHVRVTPYATPIFIVDAGNQGVDSTSVPRGIGKPLIGIGANSWSNISSGDYYGIGFGYNGNNNPTSYYPAEIGFLTQTTTGGEYGDMVFSTRPTTTGTTIASERMRITSSGNVGIGTTAPACPLHVNGYTGSVAASVYYIILHLEHLIYNKSSN